MANLGALYAALDRAEEAERFLTEAYNGRRAALGSDHPDTLNSMYRLARYSCSKGDQSRTLDLLQRAVNEGWANAAALNDPSFDSLRSAPEFEAIVAEVKRRTGKE